MKTIRSAAKIAKLRSKSSRRSRNRVSFIEQLEDRRMLASDWQNPILPTDVNGDQFTSPIDALVIINKLNRNEGGPLLARNGEGESQRDFFYDVNGDGMLSPIDVLLVINHLNGEAESQGPVMNTSPRPEGFQTAVLGMLPGSVAQLVDIQSSTIQADSRIIEFGYFSTDDAAGRIDGVLPGQVAYSQLAWQRVKSRNAKSSIPATNWVTTGLAASKGLSLYLIHADGDRAVQGSQFQINSTQSGTYDIRWEQQTSVWPGLPAVGNRVFDDAHLTVHVGVPYTDNAPPILSTVPNRATTPGETVQFVAMATDADLPNDTLTYSLVGMHPSGASINSSTGQFFWTTSTSQTPSSIPFTIRVTDSKGAFSESSFAIQITDCAFAGGGDIAAFEFGGSEGGRGSSEFASCGAVLTEGDSFVVTLVGAFVVPESGKQLSFAIDNLQFDTTDPGFVNDAFEIALLDAAGNSLVPTIANGRDSFANFTESVSPVAGTSATISGQTVSLDFSNAIPGEIATLVFRLINNDQDTLSTVGISNYSGPTLSSGTLPLVTQRAAAFSSSFQQQLYRESPLPPVAGNGPITVNAGRLLTSNDAAPELTANIEVEWIKSEFSQFPESNQGGSTPVVVDVNQDGVPDLVTITHLFSGGSPSRQVLRVINGVDGSEIWSVDEQTTTLLPYASPAVGDIDQDGKPEIVVASANGNRLAAFEHDGTFKWITPGFGLASGIGDGTISIADLNSDGRVEVIFASDVVDGIDGTVLWTGFRAGATGVGGGNAGPISVVADLDLDGIQEVVAGSSALRADGTLYWNSQAKDGYTAIGNFDNDPNPEIVLTGNGSLYILEHDGSIKLGPITIPGGGNGGSATIADFNGDGSADIAVAGDTLLSVFQADGSILWQTPVSVNAGTLGSTVFDLDGDGNIELVYRDINTLRILRGFDGEVQYEYLVRGPRGKYYPVVADVDNDGHAEIVIAAASNIAGANNGILVFGSKDWVSTRSIWNQYSYHVTNVNDDGSIPLTEAQSWTTSNTYRTNSQPRLSSIAAPVLSVNAPRTSFEVGASVVISGKAKAQNFDNAPRVSELESISVNGKPVDAIDYAGNFFSLVKIAAGENVLNFSATDTLGRTTSATLTLYGASAANQLDTDSLVDVTSSFTGVYGRTSFDDFGKNLIVDFASQGIASFVNVTPVLVGVRSISSTAVSLINPDGYMRDGTPYVSFSSTTQDAISEPPTLIFNNPTRERFSYELVFYAKDNTSPYFASVPPIEGTVAKEFQYRPTVIDAEADQLQFSLLRGPTGMDLDEVTGAVKWQPQKSDIGNHEVQLLVTDGFGGTTTQTWLIAVALDRPNRPPVITSTPDTIVFTGFLDADNSNGNYVYQVVAHDPDRDSLTYQLAGSPVGMRINSQTGLVEWKPTEQQVGNHPVKLKVMDGHGGIATQDFIICVHSAAENYPPVIVSNSIIRVSASTTGTAEHDYSYRVQATDANGDLIEYKLLDSPPGLSIDSTTGEIAWTYSDSLIAEGARNIVRDTISSTEWTNQGYLVGESSVENDVVFDGLMNVQLDFYLGDPIEDTTIMAVNRLNAETYSIASEGPILSIDSALSFRTLSNSQFIGIAVFQDGKTYLGPPQQTAGVTDFELREQSTIVARDFVLLDPDSRSLRQAGAHPDFSSHGSDVQFGTYHYIALANESSSVFGFGTRTQVNAFSVSVNRSLSYPVTVTALDGRGASDEQRFDLAIELSGAIQGNVFDDLNRDGLYFAPPSLIAATSGKVDLLNFDIEQYRFRDVALDTPSLVGEDIGGLVFGPDSLLYMSDYTNDRILRVDTLTHEAEVFAISELFGGVAGLAFGPEGWLYVANERSDSVVRLHPNNPSNVEVVVADQTLIAPRDIEFLDNEQFLLLDSLTRRLAIYTLDGVRGREYDVNPSGFGNLMTIGPDGFVYLTGHVENNVRRLDLNTGVFTDVVASNSGILEFPLDLAFGPNGNLFVVSSGNNEIVELNPNTGAVVHSLKSPELNATANLNRIVFTPATTSVEPSVSDVRIYVDTNGNYRFDETEPNAITDSSGIYRIEGLLPGGHLVSLDPLSVPGLSGNVVLRKTVVVESELTTHHVNFAMPENIGGGTTASATKPSFVSTPFAVAATETVYSYQAIAVDPNGDPLRYKLDLAPVGMTVHPTLGTVTWRPAEEQIGRYDVILRSTDTTGQFVQQRFQIEVSSLDSPPVTTFTPLELAAVGKPYRTKLTGQDSSGDLLEFTIVDGPEGMTTESIPLLSPNGTVVGYKNYLTWVPQTAQLGVHSVVLKTSDIQGQAETRTFSIHVRTILANNDPSVISTPRTNLVPGGVFVYRAEANDPDHDPLTWTLTSGPLGLTVDTMGIVRWTPTANQMGSHAVSLSVSDGQGGTATHAFTLSVDSQLLNEAPRITSNPVLAASTEFGYSYDVVAKDSDHDPARFSLDSAPRGMSIDPVSGSIRWKPTEQQFGEHEVIVVASDPVGAQSSQRFLVNVRCGNQSPGIVSTPTTRAIAERSYRYPVRGIDFEGDQLEFALTNAPTGMSIDSTSGLIRWLPTNNQLGTFAVEITVQDSYGGIGRQTFDVVVVSSSDKTDPTDPASTTFGNRPPLITSSPVFAATIDKMYEYAVTTIDPDGDQVSLALMGAPTGMQMDNAGVIRWTPSTQQIGQYTITVVATDEGNAKSQQTYLLSAALNQAPLISSTPITTVVAGAVYRYSVVAIDPENDPLTYTLEDAPAGMSIDRMGQIRFETTKANVGESSVRVTATDPQGLQAAQAFTLAVIPDTEAPKVAIDVLREGVVVTGAPRVDKGATYRVRVRATDNVSVASIHLQVNGTAVPLDGNGIAALAASQLGSVQLTANALDASGNRGDASATVQVVNVANSNQPSPGDGKLPPLVGGTDPSDQLPPIVSITSPEVGAAVSNKVPIIGTVDDPENRLWYYQVLYARLDRVSLASIDLKDPDWHQIALNTNEVINGKLAELDTTMLSSDGYAIAVVAFDKNLQGNYSVTTVAVEGSLQLGNFRLEFTDLTLPLAGIPIQVTRVYDTLNAGDQGDFGFGWSLGAQNARILETSPEGQEFIPGKSKVYLTTPEGSRVGFTYQEKPKFAGLFGDVVYDISFRPDPGVYSTLEIDQKIIGRGGLSGAFNNATVGLTGGPLMNPSKYTLTTKDGTQYRYDQFAGLEKITDRSGNTVTYTEDGIFHSSGQAITFSRDSRGRITKVTLPATSNEAELSLRYRYDAAGNLVEFIDQIGQRTTYAYRSTPAHYLDKAIDNSGRQVLTVRYDDDGRYTGVFDAAGNLIDARDYNSDQNTAIIRDGNGNATTLTYNERGNVLEEIDALGNKTIRRYEDPQNPDSETTIINRDGFVTKQKFDSAGNLLSIQQTGGEAASLAEPVTTSFTYDSDNNVTSITNALGNTTTFIFDLAGNLIRVTNALGDSSSFAYDSQGRQAIFTDFNGNKTVFTYDDSQSTNQPVRITYAGGTYQAFKYNRYGQVTEKAFHESNGTLVEVSSTTFDQLGRPMEEVSGTGDDAIRVAKLYSGDVLDWEIVINPESLNSSGLLLESPATPIDQRKSVITDYDYDELDRLVRETNAAGGVIEYRYDGNGNRVLLRDPVGNITTWVYDELDRVKEERDPFYNIDFASVDQAIADLTNSSAADCVTDSPANHVSLTCYTPEGNVAKEIDRNARRIEYTYDFASNLIEERWYSDASQLVRTLRFSYDVLGNMLTAQDPDTDYRFSYDPLNRLVKSDNNATGSIANPRVILNYDYDPQGSVIQTQDDAGVTVASEYDSRDRLISRIWFDAIVPTGGAVDVESIRIDISYNAAGRVAELKRWGDLSRSVYFGHTIQTYARSGRKLSIVHLDAQDAVLASYANQYEFSGLISSQLSIRQDRSRSQSVDYSYDLTGQLIGADYETQPDELFEYDRNGNRISWQFGSETIHYQTGKANRTSVEGASESYDETGALISQVRQQGNENQSLTYDHRGRLLFAKFDGASVEYRYNAFGSLVERIELNEIGDAENFYWTSNGIERWNEFSSEGVGWFFASNDPDEDFATAVNDRLTWNHYDQSSSLVLRATSHEIIEFTYSAFGVPLSPTNDFEAGFAGREYDAISELSFIRARWYSPSRGEWITEDPSRFGGKDANLTRYSYNTPPNARDPSGRVVLFNYTVLVGAVFVSPNAAVAVGFGLSGSVKVAAPTLHSVAGAIIGFGHGFSIATLKFAGEILSGRDWHTAIANTESFTDRVVCGLTTAKDLHDPTGFLGGYVSGVGVELKYLPDLVDNANRVYKALSCSDGVPSFKFKYGGLKSGRDKALAYFRSIGPSQ